MGEAELAVFFYFCLRHMLFVTTCVEEKVAQQKQTAKKKRLEIDTKVTKQSESPVLSAVKAFNMTADSTSNETPYEQHRPVFMEEESKDDFWPQNVAPEIMDFQESDRLPSSSQNLCDTVLAKKI